MMYPIYIPVMCPGEDAGSAGSMGSGLDSWERPLWRETRVVCGVDEAGRGPLAGPVPWRNDFGMKG